ncbi:VOC family protein [Propionibacteriaceae bacterium Y2011]
MTSAPLFHLCPYRFTDDPPGMIALLRAVGLRTVVSGPADRFAVLAGRHGRIGVHDTATAGPDNRVVSTSLGFETPDAERAADHLRSRGLQVDLIDEAYGRRLEVRDTSGRTTWINEEMHDLYGYRPGPAADTTVATAVDVVAVWFTDDPAGITDCLGHFGFSPAPNGPEDASTTWRELRSAGGVVGLHRRTHQPVDGAELGFSSEESLPTVVERLQDAGFDDAALVAEGSYVVVTDPDGRRIEIHPA